MKCSSLPFILFYKNDYFHILLGISDLRMYCLLVTDFLLIVIWKCCCCKCCLYSKVTESKEFIQDKTCLFLLKVNSVLLSGYVKLVY